MTELVHHHWLSTALDLLLVQDVKLVDVARRVAGKNKLPKAYTKALADTKYRDLDGTARLTFPTSPDHKPYQGGERLHVWF